MSYLNYGVERELVERVKIKMKRPEIKERVKMVLHNVSKADLQNRATINRLLKQLAPILGEKLTDTQTANIVAFIIGQKIDPNNTFHLLKLWGMFR